MFQITAAIPRLAFSLLRRLIFVLNPQFALLAAQCMILLVALPLRATTIPVRSSRLSLAAPHHTHAGRVFKRAFRILQVAGVSDVLALSKTSVREALSSGCD